MTPRPIGGRTSNSARRAATFRFPSPGSGTQCRGVDGPTPIQWYYAEGGEQRGPASPEEWDALLASGTVTDATLVWREGFDQWIRWESARTRDPVPPPLECDPAPPIAGDIRCAGCGQTFAEQDTVPIGRRRICAACKPEFLQRLAEGADLPRAERRPLTVEELMETDYPLGLRRTWKQGWAVFQSDPWRLMAATLCFSAIMVAIAVAGGVVGLIIPFASTLAGIFTTSQLTAGLYRVFLIRIRGHPVDLHAGFGGFGPRYWQLTLGQMVQSALLAGFGLLLILSLAPAGILWVGTMTGKFSPPLSLLMLLFAACGIGAMVAVSLLFYFLISWMFAAPLILDKGLDFWPAMRLSRARVNRHPWRFSWVLLVVSTFGMLGALVCGVGIIITGSLAGVMMAILYEDMFGELASRPTP